jgi:hypothetical protein
MPNTDSSSVIALELGDRSEDVHSKLLRSPEPITAFAPPIS